MQILSLGVRKMRSFLLVYGPTSVKRRIWDKEYSDNKWHFADHTPNDCVYPVLEKYAAKKSILDMGCGSGNTATEMGDYYQSYLGVDISQDALAKASKRSQEIGRETKNSFACGDFMSYVPPARYDVILFRESLYHVPMNQIVSTLNRYAAYLNEQGVLIVRLFAADRKTGEAKDRPLSMLAIVEENFEVLDKTLDKDTGKSTVLVFRPKRS